MSKSKKRGSHGRPERNSQGVQDGNNHSDHSFNPDSGHNIIRMLVNDKPSQFEIAPAKGMLVPNSGIAGLRPLIIACGLLDIKASTTSPIAKYRDGECLAVHIASIANGTPDFVRSEELRAQGRFPELALNVPKVMSTETLRQREDKMGEDPEVERAILECINTLAMKVKHKPNIIELGCGAGGEQGIDKVTKIFIDNSIFENDKCKKEGVTVTYDKRRGYFPVFAYDDLNMPLTGRLLEGNTSALHDINEFIDRVAAIQQKRCPDTKQLFVLDAAYDVLALMVKINNDGNYVICKVNKRRDAEFDAKAISLATSTATDDIKNREVVLHNDGTKSIYVSFKRPRKKKGLFTPEDKQEWRFCSEVRIIPIKENGMDTGQTTMKIFTVWTNIFRTDVSAREIIKLYRDRGAMEQNFGELKSHLGHEKFPSGKLATNRIVFALMLLAMTMLRIMGAYLVDCILNGNKNYDIKRRLVKTILRHFMHLPGQFITHGRKFCLKVKGYFDGIAEAFCRYCTDMRQLA